LQWSPEQIRAVVRTRDAWIRLAITRRRFDHLERDANAPPPPQTGSR
jgi:hypothetical protein